MSAVIATIGHNNPPEPTPFDLSAAESEDLVLEAKNWLDGSGVNSEADAEGVSKLLDLARKGSKRADEARKEEKRPHDEAGKAVQAKWAPVISRYDLTADTCKQALAPYLRKKDDEQRAAAAAARQKAEDEAAAAVEASRAARQGAPDLEAREQAEVLIEQAKQSEADARRAEGAKAHAKGGTRAIGLRTVWKSEVTDAQALARWVWSNRNDALLAFLADLARREVHGGMRTIPGVAITEEKVL